MTKRAKSIKDLEQQIKSDLDKIFRGAGISAFNEIVIQSPVDTGRFRGNWIATINTPSMDVKFADAPLSTNAGKPIKNQFNRPLDVKQISRATLDDALYLTNNLPYAARLAHGHSTQRTDGWIDQILLEAKQQLKNKLKDAGK